MQSKRIVQIASIPERVDSLRLTVESVKDQVDHVFVNLNNYESTPWFLSGDRKISTVRLDNSTADGAKAYNVEERDGYVLFLDDDIVVPQNYVNMMCDSVDRYKCIVSLHGKYYEPNKFKSFTHIVHNYRCLGNVLHDAVANVVGSGVMCYHTDHFKLKYSDIKSPNMADIWISKVAMEQGVKIMVLAHTESYLKHTRFDNNIFCTERDKGFVEQTKLLKEMFNAT